MKMTCSAAVGRRKPSQPAGGGCAKTSRTASSGCAGAHAGGGSRPGMQTCPRNCRKSSRYGRSSRGAGTHRASQRHSRARLCGAQRDARTNPMWRVGDDRIRHIFERAGHRRVSRAQRVRPRRDRVRVVDDEQQIQLTVDRPRECLGDRRLPIRRRRHRCTRPAPVTRCTPIDVTATIATSPARVPPTMAQSSSKLRTARRARNAAAFEPLAANRVGIGGIMLGDGRRWWWSVWWR